MPECTRGAGAHAAARSARPLHRSRRSGCHPELAGAGCARHCGGRRSPLGQTVCRWQRGAAGPAELLIFLWIFCEMNTLTDPVVAMPDVQSSVDTRHIAIQRVGVRGVRHPMIVAAAQENLPTVAEWELTVALPAHEKGTHMSRFVALLEANRRTPMTPESFCNMALQMLELLGAQAGDM